MECVCECCGNVFEPEDGVRAPRDVYGAVICPDCALPCGGCGGLLPAGGDYIVSATVEDGSRGSESPLCPACAAEAAASLMTTAQIERAARGFAREAARRRSLSNHLRSA